jgi:hypothetical protein
VTVSLSLTASDLDVLRYANLIARLGISREFHFVHVHPDNDSESAVSSAATIRVSNLVAARFEPYPDDLLVTETVRSGDWYSQLRELIRERESHLVLIAGTESTRRTASVARRLAQRGVCSVWTVPASANGRIGRILTLVDFSNHAGDSLSLAAGLARLSGLEECFALHVGEGPAACRLNGSDDQSDHWRDGLSAFSEFLKSVNSHGQAIIPLLEQARDLPGTVVESARRQAADLVVIGPTLSGRFSDDSLRILDESPVPVLMVQPEAALRMIEPAGRT